MRTQRTRENGENRVFALVYVRCLPARPQKLFHESLVQKTTKLAAKAKRQVAVGVGGEMASSLFRTLFKLTQIHEERGG